MMSYILEQIKEYKGVFIAGTDTEVGKTITTIAFISWLKQKGINACPYKPYQSGEESDIGFITSSLSKLDINYSKTNSFNLYSFKQPLSPHLASKIDGISIDINKIVNTFNKLKTEYEAVVYEGAGGLLVPITHQYLQVELIKEIELPVLLVSRPSLGTINHTLLSLELMKTNGIKCLGVIFCKGHNEENKKVIETFSDIKIVYSIPEFSNESEMLDYFKEKIV